MRLVHVLDNNQCSRTWQLQCPGRIWVPTGFSDAFESNNMPLHVYLNRNLKHIFFEFSAWDFSFTIQPQSSVKAHKNLPALYCHLLLSINWKVNGSACKLLNMIRLCWSLMLWLLSHIDSRMVVQMKCSWKISWSHLPFYLTAFIKWLLVGPGMKIALVRLSWRVQNCVGQVKIMLFFWFLPSLVKAGRVTTWKFFLPWFVIGVVEWEIWCYILNVFSLFLWAVMKLECLLSLT